MKNFTFKLLQQLNKKKADKGFTLIELLVVIIIIGILSAIALPAFLNQANKARQSEAKQFMASFNNAQKAFITERQNYAPDVSLLALGLDTATANYSYGTSDGAGGVTAGEVNIQTTADDLTFATISAVKVQSTAAFRQYQAITGQQEVLIATDPREVEATSVSVVCEELTPNSGVNPEDGAVADLTYASYGSAAASTLAAVEDVRGEVGCTTDAIATSDK